MQVFQYMPSSIKSNFVVVAKAGNGDIAPCSRAEECGAWAAGQLNVSHSPRNTNCMARLYLAAAGCETCGNLDVANRDIGVVREFIAEVPDDESATEILQASAVEKLGQIAPKFMVE